MAHRFKNVVLSIGNTPLIKLNNIFQNSKAHIYAKMESRNPLGSVKDRIGKAMIEDAEKNGKLNSESLIVEPTSGNTGLALAMVCATKGYRLILTMPETMSIERRSLLAQLGAELVLTPGNEGMKGAIIKAQEILDKNANAFMPNQFENPSNPQIHRETTALEIWDATNGEVDIFVAGVGTGGTITGVAEALKEKKPAFQAVAVEPENSPVISGGKPGPHKIQGIGAGFIPKNLNTGILDEVHMVSNESAMTTSQNLAKQEGILCGISSGAAAWVAIKLAKREENKGKTIVVLLPDTGERYLSTALFGGNQG